MKRHPDQSVCPACGTAPGLWHEYPEGAIALCRNCGLQWARDVEDLPGVCRALQDVNARYMSLDSFDWDDYPPYRDFFARLKSTASLRILDVGSGNGAFVQYCLKRGHDVRGVEIDPGLKEAMPAEVAARIRFEPIEDVRDLGGPFDLATFWDVLEHLRDPMAVLESIAPALAPGGRAFARVNNSHDVFNLASRTMLALAPPLGKAMLKVCFNLPQHRWNFRRKPMQAMLERHGWRVEHFRPTETPAERLTANPLARILIKTAYAANAMIGGGKIGEYHLSRPEEGKAP